MLENSSLSNDSLLTFRSCLIIKPASFIYITFIVINVVFFLPLFIFILYYGLQQWRKNHSNFSSSTVNHSDCFTYHLVFMELVGVIGCIIVFAGIYSKKIKAVKVGNTLFSFTWYGQGFFHILTCVEHYLAVVHPITYLTLKEKRMLRVRNIIIGFVWLLSFVGMGLAVEENYTTMDAVIMALTLLIIPFCILSVLRALNHLGPGESYNWHVRGDQSKQKAFYTVVFILLVLLMRFASSAVWMVYYAQRITNCVVFACEVLFNLPSSLVLPLLFLQRAGKLVCCQDTGNPRDTALPTYVIPPLRTPPSDVITPPIDFQ